MGRPLSSSTTQSTHSLWFSSSPFAFHCFLDIFPYHNRFRSPIKYTRFLCYLTKCTLQSLSSLLLLQVPPWLVPWQVHQTTTTPPPHPPPPPQPPTTVDSVRIGTESAILPQPPPPPSAPPAQPPSTADSVRLWMESATPRHLLPPPVRPPTTVDLAQLWMESATPRHLLPPQPAPLPSTADSVLVFI